MMRSTTLVFLAILGTCWGKGSHSKPVHVNPGTSGSASYDDVCAAKNGSVNWTGFVLTAASILLPLLLRDIEQPPVKLYPDPEMPEDRAGNFGNWGGASIGILEGYQGSVLSGDEMAKIRKCALKMIDEKMEVAWDAELINSCQYDYQKIAEESGHIHDFIQAMGDEMTDDDWDTLNNHYQQIKDRQRSIGEKFTNNPTVNKRVETITYMYTTALSVQAISALAILSAANNKTTDKDTLKQRVIDYSTDISDILRDSYDDTVQGSIPNILAESPFKTKWEGEIMISDAECEQSGVWWTVGVGMLPVPSMHLSVCVRKGENMNWINPEDADPVISYTQKPFNCIMKDTYSNKESACMGYCPYDGNCEFLQVLGQYGPDGSPNPHPCSCKEKKEEAIQAMKDQWASMDTLVENAKKIQTQVFLKMMFMKTFA